MYDDGTWMPEFFGDIPVVNGIAYPHLTVGQGVYRFRVYNGSNARFYRLGLKVKSTGAALPFFQIGSDGGLLERAGAADPLVLGPGSARTCSWTSAGWRPASSWRWGTTRRRRSRSARATCTRAARRCPQIMQFRVTGAPAGCTGAPSPGMDLRPVTPDRPPRERGRRRRRSGPQPQPRGDHGAGRDR